MDQKAFAERNSIDPILDLIESCHGLSVSYQTTIGRQLSDYYELMGQIVMIKGLVAKYEELWDQYKAGSSTSAFDLIPLNSVFVNIVMTYTKCFDASKSRPGKESRRLVKLNIDFLRGADEAIIKTHNTIIDLRNKFIAHAGVSNLERHGLRIGINKVGAFEIIEEDGYITATDKNVKYEKIMPLLDELSNKIQLKISTLHKKYIQEIETIFAKDPYKFLDKLRQNQCITDDDL